jgi:hypothetical protein
MIVDQRIPKKDHPMKIERTNWRWRVPLRHRVEDCRWLGWRWGLAFQRPHAPRDAEAAYWSYRAERPHPTTAAKCPPNEAKHSQMEMQTRERSVTTVVYLSLVIETLAVTYCLVEKDRQSQRHKSLRKERPKWLLAWIRFHL